MFLFLKRILRYKRVLCAIAAVCVACLSAGCSVIDALNGRGSGRTFDGTFAVYVTMGEDDPRSMGAMHFARLLEAYSGGELKAVVYTGNVLGSDTDLISRMMRDTGEVDIFIVSGAYFGEMTHHPELDITAMPYLFVDFESAWAFSDSAVLADFEKELPEENLRVLTHFCGGFRCITNSRRPIVTPEDLDGLIIRTPAGSLTMDLLFDLGAKAMPLPFGELNDALAKGYYDGQENPPSIIYYNKIYEAQKYLSITNHTYMVQNMTIAESIWRQLSEEQQAIVKRAAEEAAQWERIASKKENDACIGHLREAGMEVNYPELAPFVERTEALRREKARRYKDAYARVKEWLEDTGN